MTRRTTQLRGDDLRAAIVGAAQGLLDAEGPHAVTTRRVAEAAGTSTQSIYTLFGSKGGVLRALYRQGFADLAREMAGAGGRDPVARLRALARAYREAARRRPHLHELLFGRPVAEFAPDEDDLAVARTAFGHLVEAVREAQAAGVLGGGDPAAVARHFWIVVHGWTTLEAAGVLGTEDPRRVEAWYDDAVEAALAAFRGTKAPARGRVLGRR